MSAKAKFEDLFHSARRSRALQGFMISTRHLYGGVSSTPSIRHSQIWTSAYSRECVSKQFQSFNRSLSSFHLRKIHAPQKTVQINKEKIVFPLRLISGFLSEANCWVIQLVILAIWRCGDRIEDSLRTGRVFYLLLLGRCQRNRTFPTYSIYPYLVLE